MKKRSAFIVVCLCVAVVLFLTSCGEQQDGSAQDETKSAETTAVSETTVVLETTADGGTVEQDAQGNKITKSQDGKVIAVEDKDGSTISVATYLKTHSWVEQAEAADAKADDSSGAANGSGDGKKNDSDPANGSGQSQGSGKADSTVKSGESDSSGKTDETINNSSAADPDNTGKSDKEDSSANPASASSSVAADPENSGDNDPSLPPGESFEEEIPVVIATIPDEEDMVELPDL